MDGNQPLIDYFEQVQKDKVSQLSRPSLRRSYVSLMTARAALLLALLQERPEPERARLLLVHTLCTQAIDVLLALLLPTPTTPKA